MRWFEVVAATGGGVGVGVAVTTFGYGLRHGVDWDHIAAITDITGTQTSARRSMALATLYALGHGAVVFVLGVLAIVFAEQVPVSVDGVMERVVGLTLVLLGAYVLLGLVRHGRDFRLRSRWMLLFDLVNRLVTVRRRRRRTIVIEHDHPHGEDALHDHLHQDDDLADTAAAPRTGAARTVLRHRHPHRHVATVPDDPFPGYGPGTAVVVGMLHGIGAETPTQVLLFLGVAGAAGEVAGVLLLGCFLAGLFTSNTAIAAASSVGFLSASRNFAAYAVVSALVAGLSLALGILLLLGEGDVLPAIFRT